MRTSDKEVLGVNVLARSSSDILTSVPIKKRRFMLARSPSPPHDVSPSLPANSDVPQKSSESESFVSETSSQPALGTTKTHKGSCEMRAESTVRKDLNVSPKHENLPRSTNQHGLGSNMDGKDPRQKRELTPDNICRLLPVTGATQLLSAHDSCKLPVKESCSERKHVPNDTSAFPTVTGNAKFQLAFEDPLGFPEDRQNSDSISVKREKSYSCSLNIDSAARNLQNKGIDAESNVESSLSCLNRSNWDLNTTMDAWVDLPNDSTFDSANGSHSLDVGGIHERPGLEPVQMLCKVANGVDATVGKFMLGNSAGSPSLSMSLNDGSHSETCLDLQLKPSFMAESFFKWGHKCPLDKVDSIKDMPHLSLSVEPVLADCNSTPVACRAVKTEPCDQGSQKDSRNIEICGLKSPVEHVKSEPREGQKYPERLCPSDLKSACSGAVKSEPFEDKSQGYLRKQDRVLTTQSIEISQDATEHVSTPLESSVSDDNLLHKSTQLDGAIILQGPSQIVIKTLESVVQGPTPHYNEKHHGGKTLMFTDIPRYGKENVTESSDLDQESLVLEDKNSHMLDGASKFVALTSAPSKPSLSDIHDHVVAGDKLEVVGQMSIADGHISSDVASAVESPIDSSVKNMFVESSEKKIEQFAGALEKSLDLEMEPSSHEETETVVVHKRSSQDDEYEDGEFRDLALQGTVEGERERNQIKAADSSCPIDVHIEMTSCIDLKEDKIENPEESKIHDTKSFDGGQCCHKEDPGNSTITNVDASSSVDIPTPGSVKRRLSKAIRKVPRVQLKGKKPERKSESDRALSASTGTGTKGSHDDVSSQQPEALLLDVPVSKKESSIEDEVEKERGSGSRIIGLKPVPDGLTSEKGKSFPGRMISLRMEKERSVENSPGSEKSRSQRIRDEKRKYRSQIFERARNKYQQLGRRRSDLMHSSRTENQINTRERNLNHEHVLEQIGSSGTRYARPVSEDALAVAPNSSTGNAGRMARMLMNDDSQNLSNMTCRGRLPSRRGRIPVGNQMNRHPNEVNPSHHTGRDGPDFLLRAHEERLMRTMPDDRMVPMVPHACSQYDRMGGNPNRRERRSLSPLVRRERSISPIQRRVPLEFPPACMESSPRSLSHQLHQWSPPRRSPDGFNGPPELMGRVIRPDRMRSPHQRLRFTEDMIVRRGSPPCNARLPDDIDSSRERDFSRPVRGLQRTIRRFDTIDSHNFSEEYFSPVIRDQYGELVRDVECDDRSCNGRHERHVIGLRRPFRQQRILSDDVDETFSSHIDGGGPGPYRFCHEDNDGFPERGSPREYEGNIRNRLGGRSRVIEEQEDNYRYRGEPGWRDEGISDIRQKRRRV